MNIKKNKLILILSFVGFVNFTSGTAIAGSEGATHNVADLNKTVW